MNEQKETLQKVLLTYGSSVLLTLLMLLITRILLPFTGSGSLFSLYILGVLAAAVYQGAWAGFLTTALTSVTVDYFFLPPLYPLKATNVPYVYLLGFFFIVGILASMIVHHLQYRKDMVDFKRKEREYLQLLSIMQKENRKYQQEIKARDEFLSLASHELKTPLSSLLLQLQTALHNIRNVSLANFSVENLLKMLQSAEQQSVRLSKMINDLLNTSLITTGRLELEREPVDLSTLVQDVIDQFAAKEKDGARITLTAAKNVVGEWDKLRIEQVVTNLLSNAIKYGDDKPIEVTVSKHDAHARLSVTDHGIGIPKEQQEKIFEKFKRGVSNHDYQGLGVGLYITAQIVKVHEGKITVRSKQNHGSTFTVELPLKNEKKK